MSIKEKYSSGAQIISQHGKITWSNSNWQGTQNIETVTEKCSTKLAVW